MTLTKYRAKIVDSEKWIHTTAIVEVNGFYLALKPVKGKVEYAYVNGTTYDVLFNFEIVQKETIEILTNEGDKK